MRFTQTSSLRLALLLVALTGCTNSAPQVVEVHGTVTYRGAPLKSGNIFFQPKDAKVSPARPVSASIAPDGTYSLRAFPGRDGVLPGEYLVAVDSHTDTFREADTVYLVPKRYVKAQTSGLTANVPADAKEPVAINFELAD